MTKNTKSVCQELMLSLSSKCNRGCSHCYFDSNMKGTFFSPENAVFLAEELAKANEKNIDKFNLEFFLHFSGNGESLLNPNFEEIMDIIFEGNPFISGSFITSGVDPKNSSEEKRLVNLLSKPYANRLNFCVSFNLFEKDFSKRITRTLDILFENSDKKVGIKICLPKKRVYLPILKLHNLLEKHFIENVREENPIILENDNEIIEPIGISYRLKEAVKFICWLDKESKKREIKEAANKHLINIRSSEDDILAEMIDLKISFNQSFILRTKFGERRIDYLPHSLTCRGRAKNMPWEEFPKNVRKTPCCYMIKSLMPCINSDGYYYLTPDCLKIPTMKIGQVTDNLLDIIFVTNGFLKMLLQKIILDQRPYEDICELCSKIAAKRDLTLWRDIIKYSSRD